MKINFKKHLKLIAGILGLAAVIAWSGGLLIDKTKPGMVEALPGIGHAGGCGDGHDPGGNPSLAHRGGRHNRRRKRKST